LLCEGRRDLGKSRRNFAKTLTGFYSAKGSKSALVLLSLQTRSGIIMQDLKITIIQADLHWEDIGANLAMFEEKIWQIDGNLLM
jgi:hypothetical protein